MLLVNLGSPDSYQVKDVKKYLDQFLMDERVIDLPLWKRNLLVRGIILNTRPKKSAEAYKSIWWEEGSPLIVLSERLLTKVQQFADFPVGLAMRYGNPSIKKAIQELVNENPDLKEIKLIPLYPHYAMSSYETVVVEVQKVREAYFPNIQISVKRPFYKDEDYLSVLTESIKPYLNQEFDQLLFSYHGIPERHVQKSDITKTQCLKMKDCCAVDSPVHEFCYRHQTLDSSNLIASRLGLSADQYTTSFQSRLGRDPWLTPFTDKTIASLPAKGVKRLLVVCPAFVSDCLETIEEIGEEAKEIFIENGGKDFRLIPCLNDDDKWAKTIVSWGL